MPENGGCACRPVTTASRLGGSVPGRKAMTNHDDGRQEVADILNHADIAVLTTVNSHNQLVSRPLALQAADFDGELWFFTHDPSPKADEIRSHPQVNVSVHAGGG